MKKILITLLILMVSSQSWSEKYYVLIQKEETEVEFKDAIGHMQKGDAILLPYKENDPPTKTEQEKYHIVIVDLTEAETFDIEKKQVDENGSVISDREVKFSIDSFKNDSHMKEITKNEFDEKIVYKSVADVNFAE